MLLLFRGFSRLRFGLGAFFVLPWFSFAVFRVGPLLSPLFLFLSSGSSLMLFCFGRRLPSFLYVLALPALEGFYFSGVCSLSHGLLGYCLAPPLVSSSLSLFLVSGVPLYRSLLLLFLRLRPCVCSSSPPS